jgi:hypothetical protein
VDEQAFGLSNIPTEEYMCLAHSIKAAETGMQCPPPPPPPTPKKISYQNMNQMMQKIAGISFLFLFFEICIIAYV